MEDIPEYHYLYPHGSPEGAFSLIQVFDIFLNHELRKNFYFSRIGNRFTGFLIYEDTGKIIDKVKMASFYKKGDLSLTKDLINFLLDKAGRRDRIDWTVDPNNTGALLQYNKLLDSRRLNWRSFPERGFVHYVVQGFKG
jgi:hypothetical protein